MKIGRDGLGNGLRFSSCWTVHWDYLFTTGSLRKMASDLRAWLLPNANEQSPGNIKRGLILQIRKAIAPQLGYGYGFLERCLNFREDVLP